MGYSDEVLADSPWCYYRLNEPSGTTSPTAITDASGNGNHGEIGQYNPGEPGGVGWTSESGMTSDMDDAIRPAYNTYISTPVPPASTSFTLEAIVRADELTSVASLLISRVSMLHLAFFESSSGATIGAHISEHDYTGIPPGGIPVEIQHGNGATVTTYRSPARHHVWITQKHVVNDGDPFVECYVDGVLTVSANFVASDPFHTNRPPWNDVNTNTDVGLWIGEGGGNNGTFTVDEFAYYPAEVSASRIADRLAFIRNDFRLALATETDASGQIGYPRSIDFGQAPSPFVFDPTEQLPQDFPQPGTGEYAQRIGRAQAAFLPLGKAIETDTTDELVVDLIPWTSLDLSLTDFHTSPTPDDFGFYADGLIQPNTFGFGPTIQFTHPDLRLADLDASTYYDIEITFDSASTITFTELNAYLDDSDDQWWNESPYDLGTFGGFTATPLVVRMIIGPSDGEGVFGEWDEAFAANYESLNFSFGNRSYISQIRWRVSGYVSAGPVAPPPIQVVGPEPATTRRVFPPRRLAAR